jgi:hypothetical protein
VSGQYLSNRAYGDRHSLQSVGCSGATFGVSLVRMMESKNYLFKNVSEGNDVIDIWLSLIMSQPRLPAHSLPVKSIVIFFNDYPNNHHTIRFKYILFSTAV